MLSHLPLIVLSPSDCGIESLPVEEDGETFEANAFRKAMAYMQALNLPAIADDSGLSVDALGGAPGIHSARYGGGGLTDQERVRLLLDNLSGVPMHDRTAHFTSAIAFACPDGNGFVAEGECHGYVTLEESGEGGFGYDPVFFYAPAGCTFAAMPIEEKNRVSHRAVAMRLFVDELEKRLGNGQMIEY